MKILFDHLPDRRRLSMTMNRLLPNPQNEDCGGGGAARGRTTQSWSGTIQNDILNKFMVRNTYIYPPEASMRIIQDVSSSFIQT